MLKYPKYLEPWFTQMKCEDCVHIARENDMAIKIRVNQANKKTEKDLVCSKCGSYNLVEIKK